MTIYEFLESRVGEKRAEKKSEMLLEYMKHILQWNDKVNLTAIKEEAEFEQKHLIDSLLIMDCVEFLDADSIIDVGTGGGFPGIPLAIMFPDKQFVLVDSLQKRLKIIQEGIDLLGLKNVKLVHGRAEDLARDKKYREKFDLAISRALANMSVLLELTIPFVKEFGYSVAYKGTDYRREIDEAEVALEKLKSVVENVYLPDDQGTDGSERLDHTLVFIIKEEKTPKAYPRKAGTPAKDPIK